MCPAVSAAGDESTLNYSRQIQYWRRNLKTFLPNAYTGNDNNRMYIAYFTLSALDILGDLQPALSAEERQGFIDWVYHCQLPEGGFRPSPATDFGSQRSEENRKWDPAHMPGTFFALLNLILLGDDLSRVKRREILKWLNQMQRPDGSFGEFLGEGGRVEGGVDTRFGYMGAGIRWILRGTVEGTVEGIPDVDVDKFVKCIQMSEVYDGGISEAPFHEAHAGFTCTAISALYLVDRLPLKPPQPSDNRIRGVTNLHMTLHWLVSRLTLTLDEEDALDTYEDETDSAATCHDAHAFVKLKSYPSKAGEMSFQNQPTSHFELQWVGVNGRCNKIADTCYSYWACASLASLGYLELMDTKPIRRWLLDKIQHTVGGFGKLPGDPPDIYHSFLGLVVLAMFGEAGLRDVDAALCMTNKAKAHIETLPWRKAIHQPHRQFPNADNFQPSNFSSSILHSTTPFHHPAVTFSTKNLVFYTKMPPPTKKRKTSSSAPQEITFDPAAREEYLTGFHKRKQARIKHAQEESARKEKEEKLRLRRDLRKQRKENLERHVSEVNQLLREANGDVGGNEDTQGDESGDEEEFQGFDDAGQEPEPIDREDEYVDEEKFTTVTIESVGIDRSGFTKDAAGDEAKENVDGEEGGKPKRVWTKEKPKIERPKKKKVKFRYESKADRKAERVKVKAKRKTKAEARKAK
ncbi:terpenoid cyclases/Protein prenyltransferase [Polyplosphaeria fusca]|uniref:Terpenoid cyclases/Protein prenyltransferase n=1 Tax=Polyplosphaeria fusca TaxID=682080 RepID=A0A9P4V727_9PLEO|nr:terpenoid cyclases/Protein prenyltransferase [Polyplosphaeria fusca]